MLSGGFADRTGHPLAVLPLTDVAYSLRVNILLTSQVWNFAPPAQNYARSRGAAPSVKKASAFLTVSKGYVPLRHIPFCQQPLSGSCYSICFLIYGQLTRERRSAGSCVVAPAFVISYKFEKNFWKRSYKLWDLGSESHDDELRYCGGGSGGDDSHFCGAADDGIRSCRRAVRPCGSRSRSRGRRRQACSPGQISLCRRSRSSGSRGGTERV